MQGTIGPRYTDLLTLRQYLSSSGNVGTADDGLLQDCILRAEGAIDDYTRRNFAGTAGTVYYNRYAMQRAGQALYLDQDLHTLVGVVNGDGQTIPVGSVWVEPRNEGPPYRVLRLKSSYVWTWNTDTDITISGTFGFGTIPPPAVVQATLRTATYYYRSKDDGFGQNSVAAFPEAGELPVTQGLPQDVRWLLSPFRSKTGGVV